MKLIHQTTVNAESATLAITNRTRPRQIAPNVAIPQNSQETLAKQTLPNVLVSSMMCLFSNFDCVP